MTRTAMLALAAGSLGLGTAMASQDDAQMLDVEPGEAHAEYKLIDRNGNGVVTATEFAMSLGQFANVTEEEARDLFDMVAGDDDELTHYEFVTENPEYRSAFEAAVTD